MNDRGSAGKLLVSVRNVQEAQLALREGADLIDVKEPRLGSLGKAADEVICEVVAALSGSVPVSVALGELRDWLQPDSSKETATLDCAADKRLSLLPAAIAYAKLGLAGCASRKNWSQQLERVNAFLPQSIRPVAVAYADWEIAEAPEPREVLEATIALGYSILLVDTFLKEGSHLLDSFTRDDLWHFVEDANSRGVSVVVAGSLTAELIMELRDLPASYFAVRSAVCAGSRKGGLLPGRVAHLKELLGTCFEAPVSTLDG